MFVKYCFKNYTTISSQAISLLPVYDRNQSVSLFNKYSQMHKTTDNS